MKTPSIATWTIAASLFAAIAAQAQDARSASPLDVYSGTYRFKTGGAALEVRVDGDALRLDLPTGDLFRFSDARVDPRALAAERKTLDLMRATRAGSRDEIARLFGASNGPMEAYVDRYLSTISAALEPSAEVLDFELIGTTYRDEDSDYGFEDSGWGWETYVRVVKRDGAVVVRVVWDGTQLNHMHTGVGKQAPSAQTLRFVPRAPSRSWIRVFDPNTGTIVRLRELPQERRPDARPARFVAYDIATHHTVGIRFRRESAGRPMSLEIGPLGSDVSQVAVRQR